MHREKTMHVMYWAEWVFMISPLLWQSCPLWCPGTQACCTWGRPQSTASGASEPGSPSRLSCYRSSLQPGSKYRQKERERERRKGWETERQTGAERQIQIERQEDRRRGRVGKRNIEGGMVSRKERERNVKKCSVHPALQGWDKHRERVWERERERERGSEREGMRERGKDRKREGERERAGEDKEYKWAGKRGREM